MTPTQIEVQPDTANQLLALAETQNVSLDTLLRALLRQTVQAEPAAPRWRLAGSIELLDEDLASGSRDIARRLQESLRQTAQDL